MAGSDGIKGISMIVRRSMRQYALSTLITALSIALGSGLVMAVFAIRTQAYRAFTGGEAGFDAVLGARGSQLQLVLNAVFHLETSPGNIPWTMYEQLRRDPRVTLAIPYAVGDSYRGFRIVGTTSNIFTEFEYSQGRKFQVEPGGRFFADGTREAVIGSFAAQANGLRVGATFNPYHGLIHDERQRHKDQYTVVGVLAPMNSPSDRVIWIPIDGVYRMSGHVLRGSGELFRPQEGEAIPEESKEVSAVMLKLRDPQSGFQLDQTINKQGKAATLAWPVGRVMAELFDKLGWMNRILELVAWLVIVVAAGSILASIYNTINERRREFAILRALGARRATVFAVIVTESAAIALLGSLGGYVVYAGILIATKAVVKAQTGVVLAVWQMETMLWLTPLVMIAVGMLAGLIPAYKAYRTNVAEHLAPIS
ncbi:MAG: FtsX-like permease family protein [Blastocatellia bacterium]|nr:FtsX-like permease family protein [Blastocatellia bacterium]